MESLAYRTLGKWEDRLEQRDERDERINGIFKKWYATVRMGGPRAS